MRESDMLVLSRKENEKIMIGDDVVGTVVALVGGRVRIGIEAPRSMAVDREGQARLLRGVVDVVVRVERTACPQISVVVEGGPHLDLDDDVPL